MKLAVNWSPQADALFREGAIDVDLWKAADWPEIVEPAKKTGKPCYVHFPLRAGDGSQPDWGKVREWLATTDTHYVNMHFSGTMKDFPDIPFESREPEHRMRVVDAMVRDIEAAAKEVGMDRIIVENLPTLYDHDRSDQTFFAAADPETIRATIGRTGCGLLFDIDHARGAAWALNMPYDDYVAVLPLDRLRELHMTGTLFEDGLTVAHHPMAAVDWPYFDQAIANIRSGTWSHPSVYAFEYGGIGENFRDRSDANILREQVPMLLAKVRSLNK